MYKTAKILISIVKFSFLFVAIPLIIPTIAVMEIIDAIEHILDNKIKEGNTENGSKRG